jgi:excinuclease ABC subunit C
VYIFEDKNEKPLYIGKSINLRSRLKQHYEGFQDGTSKALQFFPQTKTLYLKPVKNDIEAVICEANLIKQYQPRYNSVIKDGRSNLYLVFTNPPNPKVVIIRGTDLSSLNLDNLNKQVFGPFSSTTVAKTLYKQMRNIFGFCLNPFNAHKQACFYYHIRHCPGACKGEISPTKYAVHLGKLKKFLSGQFILLDRSLHQRIKREIQKGEYEKAHLLKQQINGLHYLLSTHNTSLLLKLSDATDALQYQIVEKVAHPLLKKPPVRIECYDLAHLQGENYVGSMAVYLKGSPAPAEYRHFNIHLPDKSDPFAMKQILKRRFAHPEWPSPDLIILDGGLPQLSTVFSVIPSVIPVLALAKKRETLYFYNSVHQTVSINLPLEDPVLNLFRSLRDEAHRLANSLHRKQRRKNLLIEYN